MTLTGKKLMIGLAVMLLCMAAAQTVNRTFNLVVNGTSSSHPAIQAEGETYVPLSALEGGGATALLNGDTLSLTLPGVVRGGANQRDSVEGCQGTQLFNGIWRLEVAKVEPMSVDSLSAWGVTVELRNGTDKTLTVYQTGFDTGGKGAFLGLESGVVLSFDSVTRDISNWGTEFAFATVPPGGAVVYQMNFYTDAGKMTDKPTKFLLEIDPSKNDMASQGLDYAVAEPSFRVLLNCVN
jgi:hypothetical protein